VGTLTYPWLTATSASSVTPPARSVDFLSDVQHHTPAQRLGWDSKEEVHLVTSLPAEVADPATLARLARDHWSTEVVHHQRDTLHREDQRRVITETIAVNLAALRNAVLTGITLLGQASKAMMTWANAHHRNAAALIQGRVAPSPA
ncbi:hypothetical protein SAMN06264364_1663, partial [Quadrisphaera granulorum]